MTTPSGLLAWGQAGQYNGVDDRAVITALANTKNGIVKAVALSAGSGLVVNIAAGWLAVANCGDGTSAVIGSRVVLPVTVPAGPASGTLTSYIWADVNPDAATYTINVITPAQASGRSGVQLGTVVANAGNNLASQMTLINAPVSFGNFDGIVISTAATGGTAYLEATSNGCLYVSSRTPNSLSAGTLVQSLQDGTHRVATASNVILTPQYNIPLGDVTAWSHYKIHADGQARCSTPQAAFWFDMDLAPLTYQRITFAANLMPANQFFFWWIDGHIQVDQYAGNLCMSLKIDITSAVGTSFTGCQVTANVPMPTTACTLCIRSNIGQLAGTPGADCWSSVFQRFGGRDPSGQVTP